MAPAGRRCRRRAQILDRVLVEGARVESDAARARVAGHAQLHLLPRAEPEAGRALQLDPRVLLVVPGVDLVCERDLGFSAEGPVFAFAADAGELVGLASDADAHAHAATDLSVVVLVLVQLGLPLQVELPLSASQFVHVGADGEVADGALAGELLFGLGLDVPGEPILEVVEVRLPLLLGEQLKQGAQSGLAFALNIIGFLTQHLVHLVALGLEPFGALAQVSDRAPGYISSISLRSVWNHSARSRR